MPSASGSALGKLSSEEGVDGEVTSGSDSGGAGGETGAPDGSTSAGEQLGPWQVRSGLEPPPQATPVVARPAQATSAPTRVDAALQVRVRKTAERDRFVFKTFSTLR
jgi:hypothetical protein